LKNITNSFNEIIISKTLSSQQAYTNEISNNKFSSLLNDNSNKQEEELKQEQEKKQSSDNTISPQVELQNISYLNKLFLFSVV